MRNVKYNFLKISCFFGVLFYFTIDAIADDNPEATDRKAQFYSNQESGAGDVPGQQCINYLNAPKKMGNLEDGIKEQTISQMVQHFMLPLA